MSSLVVLLASNVIALAIAWRYGMSLRDLMTVYWIQSLVIGATNAVRLVGIGWQEWRHVPWREWELGENPLGQKTLYALFFVAHYGIFHLVYAIGIDGIPGALASDDAYLACAAVFALNHGYSLILNLRRDAVYRPKAGVVMVLPYARIIPMHLTLILGVHYAGAAAFFFFAGLKILADIAMHLVERRVLGPGKAATGVL